MASQFISWLVQNDSEVWYIGRMASHPIPDSTYRFRPKFETGGLFGLPRVCCCEISKRLLLVSTAIIPTKVWGMVALMKCCRENWVKPTREKDVRTPINSQICCMMDGPRMMPGPTCMNKWWYGLYHGGDFFTESLDRNPQV